MANQKRPTVGLLRIFLGLALFLALAAGVVVVVQRYMNVLAPGTAAQTAPQAIEAARTLIGDGKFLEARQIVEPLVARLKKDPLNQQALVLLARIEQGSNAPDKALEALKRAVSEFPQSPDTVSVQLAYAKALEDTGKADEAVKVYAEVRESAPPEMRAAATTALGRQAEKANDLPKARELYTLAAREAKWDSDPWKEASQSLGRVNVALIFSPAETPDSRKYAVERGDNLLSIGMKLNTTQGLLMRANGLSENPALSVGQQLKYTPKDFRIVIERSKCRLFLLDKDGIFKWYYAGLGMPGHETTLGSYKIGNKEKDPVWHKPGAGPIPAGDPANELGTRWMPFVPQLENLPTDLGVHGTIKPETVGTFASHGCARLLNAEVEELYDLVVRSTPVDIVETFAPPEGS